MTILWRRALTTIAAQIIRRRQLYPPVLQKARRRGPKLVFSRLRIWLLGEPGILPDPDEVRALRATLRDMPKAGFYAVSAGLKPGIYETWSECEAQVKGFPGAVYKKFTSHKEAQVFIGVKAAKPYARPDEDAEKSAASTLVSEQTIVAPVNHQLSPELAKIAQQGYTITLTKPHHLVVYTDGSSRGNGKRDAMAGLGVWWSGRRPASKINLSERLPGRLQTNNRGELLAIIRALETCPYPDLPLEIRTDSKYSISFYLPNWIRNNFKTSGMHSEPIKNKDLILHLLALLHDRGPTNGVKFKHVAAHRGETGNEGADRLANQGALSPAVPDRTDWRVPEDLSDDLPAAERPVDVEIEVDESWLMTAEEIAVLERET